MADHKIKLGVIGAGLAVKWLHWPALKQMPDKYEVVMVADINRQNAQEIIELVGGGRDISYTADYHELLASNEVEAVLSAMPIDLSATVMLDAVKAGKHIIGEKPLAKDWPEAVDLVQQLQKLNPDNKLAVEVAENFHYRRDFLKAREWIQSGKIGQVFLIEMTANFWTDINSGFGSTPWRHQDSCKFRGGAFTDGCVHNMAGLRELGGEVAELHAFAASRHPVIAHQDTVVVNLLFKDGALGSFGYTGAARAAKGTFGDNAVFGTEGTITLTHGKVTLQHLDSGNNPETFEIPNFDNGYYDEFYNFWDAIVNNAKIVSTPQEALRDFELVMRILDSAETGQIIKIGE